MSNISFQVIPFAFLFLLLIFLSAIKKNTPKKQIKKNDKEENLDDFKEFLEDSEKKLLALRELYKQELINLDMYTNKTKKIANTIIKTIGKDISELASNKSQIYNQLRNDIKIKANLVSNKKSKKNIDSLISAVDKRIESGLNYDG